MQTPGDSSFVPPTFEASAFNCPHTLCGAYAQQTWGDVYFMPEGAFVKIDIGKAVRCSHCNRFSVWVDEAIVYPSGSPAPRPHQDLPTAIIEDFEEARQIVLASPRGAAALLRLCIQKLCIHLGEPGKDLNSDIASLVEKGLPEKIQKALDLVRVVGNNAVHPGQIDIADDPATALRLFSLLNLITDVMISQPSQVDSLYDELLSDTQKEQIVKRDEGV